MASLACGSGARHARGVRSTLIAVVVIGCGGTPAPAPARPPPSAPAPSATRSGDDDVVVLGGGGSGSNQPAADLAAQLDDARNPDPRGIDSLGGAQDPPRSKLAVRMSRAGGQALDTSSLTLDAVAAKVMAAYAPGIKRCYKRALANTPDAHGTLSLTLRVSSAGRTLDAKAVGVADEVDACVVAQMASWRFAIPKDGNGDPVDASFAIAFDLARDQ